MSENINKAAVSFTVSGIDCLECAAEIEKALQAVTGVLRVQVDLAPACINIDYDKSVIQPGELTRVLANLGYQPIMPKAAAAEASYRSVFRLSGLDCGDCAAKLEKRVAALNGVQSATVNFGAGKLTVEHMLDEAAIIKAVEQAGYKVRDAGAAPEKAWWAEARTIATAVSGVLVAVAFCLNLLGLEAVAVNCFYAAAAVIGGYHAAKSGLYGLKAFAFDMNLLMTVAIVGAAAIGQWSEGAVVAFLFSLGNTLQTYTMDKTRRSLRALMELAPVEALVRRGGQEVKLPVGEVAVGEVIIVKPAERIALDGEVVSGISAVNEAAITGESIPVDKESGSQVYAGTVNGQGVLEIAVTRRSSDSTLARIMHLVEEAQEQRAPSQQFVDKFAKYYTPAVLLVAAGVVLLPPLLMGQPFAHWFYQGLVLLVISCPCALVISTPVSIVAAIGNASHRGVLIKGGAYLEKLGAIRSIAFDKTGTLTTGRPVVTDIVPVAGLSGEELLLTAAAVERWSEHPLAKAVNAKAAGLELPAVTAFEALTGRGAKADLGGRVIYVGNLNMFSEMQYAVDAVESSVAGLEEQGKTTMLVGCDNRILGVIAVADEVRSEAAQAVKGLRKAGMEHVAMLTGDNDRVAAAIASGLGLDAHYSELLPEDKVNAIRKLRNDFDSVVMIGEGVNDAPALAAADVGVAMGVAGTDAALETADVALMADDLSKVAYIISLSRKTLQIIKQNIAFAIIIKALFIVLTFAGMANLWLAVFADTGASLLVTANGMRLMRELKA